MDFEMAVWEMTHLLIAPKKVFKSIYYHKRQWKTPSTSPLLTMTSRDEKYLASTGSFLHLPPVLLSPPHVLRLVPGIHALLGIGG